MPPPDLATIPVFAYGSNLCRERLRARVPSARRWAIGCVFGRTLAFHKRGRDGSAKADAAFTGHANDSVWGVVYQVAASEKPLLDRYESLGVGYDEVEVPVATAAGVCYARMYVARPEAIVTSLRPFSWYRDFVVHGAVEHGLPGRYLRRLCRVTAEADPDRSRHASNAAVVRRCLGFGPTTVIRHAPGLEVLATNSIGEPVDASPVLVDDDILIRGADHLFCLTETP